MEMTQNGSIENYFQTNGMKENEFYTADQVQNIIDEISSFFNLGANKWHVKEMITNNFDNETKWSVIMYIFKNLCKTDEKNYVALYSDTKNILDLNGNFYTTETEYLQILSTEKYTIFKNNEIIVPMKSDINYLSNLENRFEKIFNAKGVKLLKKFVSQLNENAEIELKKFPFIFSFFYNLLELNSDVGFVHENNITYIVSNNAKREIPFDKLEDYQSFRDFFSLLKIKPKKLKFVLDEVLRSEENKINMPNNDQKNEYLENMEKEFSGNNEEFGDLCQTTALQVLQRSSEKSISIMEFKQIVYWIKFLWKESYENRIDITSEKIDFFSTKLKNLLNAVKTNENQNHRFVNYYSAAYHTNAHFGGLTQYRRWKRNKTKISDENFIVFLNETIDVNTDMLKEEEMWDKDTLNKCVTFYLHAVANCIFYYKRLSSEVEKNPWTKYYYHLENIKGVKVKHKNGIPKPAAVTIYYTKKEINSSVATPSAADRDQNWRKN